MGRTILVIIVGFWVTACTSISTSEEWVIRVDLAAEHDKGRFIPEEGDWLSLAAEFSDWEPGDIRFTDEDGDWIFQASIPKSTLASDSLNFKLVIQSDENRDLPNSGWEAIPNRQVTGEELAKENPVFVFNKPWSPLVAKELTFRLNMSNQKVLGFFDPDMGDKVAVTGGFNDWNEEGVLLEPADDSLVYQLALPVEVRTHEPLIFAYLIIPGTGRNETIVMPNKGREFINSRYYRENPATDYFNNQKRILRVEIAEEWVTQRTTLKQDDQLHLKLMWNGSLSRNYRLEPTGNGAFEAALIIPESAADLRADLMVNYEEVVYEFNKIKVGLAGKNILIGM